jgi:hypothetical protein
VDNSNPLLGAICSFSAIWRKAAEFFGKLWRTRIFRRESDEISQQALGIGLTVQIFENLS